jgi:anti-sigma-K factor RskA
MPYDVNHALKHPEVAGWVLGVLDPDDAQAFEEHRGSCNECQAVIAEFEPVARSFKLAAPEVEPPADLEARTVAAVQHAVMTADRPQETPARASRWWHLHWTNRFMPMFTAVAAAALTAAAFVGVQVFQLAAPAVAATINLHAKSGHSESGLAVARRTAGGFKIQLTVSGLPRTASGQFYECWYAAGDNRPGHPDLIAAGTFTVDRGGSETFTMWSAADPAGRFNTMQITAGKPGDAGQQGPVILEGSVKT